MSFHLVSCLDMLLLQPYQLLPLCFRLKTASGFFFACIVYFRHNIEFHALRRTHMIKVVAVAVPWNNFGHLPVLEATCRLCLEGFKIIEGCIVSIIDVGKQLKRNHVLVRKQYLETRAASKF